MPKVNKELSQDEYVLIVRTSAITQKKVRVTKEDLLHRIAMGEEPTALEVYKHSLVFEVKDIEDALTNAGCLDEEEYWRIKERLKSNARIRQALDLMNRVIAEEIKPEAGAPLSGDDLRKRLGLKRRQDRQEVTLDTGKTAEVTLKKTEGQEKK